MSADDFKEAPVAGEEDLVAPSLYLSHGSPTIVLQERSTAHQFIHRAGLALLTGSKLLPTKDPKWRPENETWKPPSGIVVVSAHWTTRQGGPLVSAAGPKPKIIYDFGGFPRTLFEWQYDHQHMLAGSSKLAGHINSLLNANSSEAVSEVLASMRKSGLSAHAAQSEAKVPDLKLKSFASQIDPNRGWDHGVWTLLTLLFPSKAKNADKECCNDLADKILDLQAEYKKTHGGMAPQPIPVCQLSLPINFSHAELMSLGQRLAWLRKENVLVLSSGSAVHNLHEIDLWSSVDRKAGRDGWEQLISQAKCHHEPNQRWAADFINWLRPEIKKGNADNVVNFVKQAPNGSGIRAHPTDEHFTPLLVALGAGSEPWKDADGSSIPGDLLHDDFEFGTLGMHAFSFPSEQ